MKQDLAERVLGQIMDWDSNRCVEEFGALQLKARFKFDNYQDFVAGGRFLESLARWLQQFAPEDRETAYSIVKDHLVFISEAEMQRLVESFYPNQVEPLLLHAAATELGVQPWLVWAHPDGVSTMERLARQCLYMGLSEGARLDRLRRANIGRISNEQVVLQTQIDESKWLDLKKSLRESLDDEEARFRYVFLLDDFVGTGTTFLRPDGNGGWKGKLIRFKNTAERAINGDWFAEDLTLQVHHYIASHQARRNVDERLTANAQGENPLSTWFPVVDCTYGLQLPETVEVTADRHPDLVAFLERYYSSEIQDPHTAKGGKDRLHLGFGGCGLPLILEHNTPNNSMAILWAEAFSPDEHPMRPLFRRRQRHG